MSRFFSRALPTLPQPLRVFCAASVVLTLIGMAARFVCAHFLHLAGYPWGYYVTRVDGLDLMTFYTRVQYVHTADFFSPAHGPAYAYPGAVAPIYWLLFRVRYAQIPFVLLGGGMTVVLGWLFARALERRGVARWDARWFVVITLLCSYPLYFEFARGNVEIFMWVLTAVAVYEIPRDRVWLGAGLLGIAIAMKMYPFVLLGLLLTRRRYGPIVFSVVVAVLYSVFGLWVVSPDIGTAWRGINFGLQSFQQLYVVPYRPILSGVDHSLYGLIKRVLGPLPWSTYAHILKVYTWTGALAGLVAYFARIRKLPVINQVLCLTVATVMLPPISFDYTLIHLYTPFVLWALWLVSADRRVGVSTRGMRALLVCFIVLFAQVGEVISHGDRLGGQIKAVALLVLFILGLWFPVQSEWDRLPAEPPERPELLEVRRLRGGAEEARETGATTPAGAEG